MWRFVEEIANSLVFVSWIGDSIVLCSSGYWRFMPERSVIFVVGKNNYVTIITFYCFGSLVELTKVTYCICGNIAEVLGFYQSLQNYNKFVKLEQMKLMVKMTYLIV